MFEKEAEEYGNEYWDCLVDSDDREMLQEAYKDGAEFGYNKAKGEVITEATKNYNAIIADYEKHYKERIAELEKANEWHYVKDGDFPKSEGSYYVAMDNGRGYKSGAILNWVEETDCEEDFHWEDDDYECFDEQVYAWKECPVLPPKESK